MRSRIAIVLALSIVALAAWAASFAALALRPVAALGEASGLYEAQGGTTPYRWTSNRVAIPIHAGSGPTALRVSFGPARWEGRAAPTITLGADEQPIAVFAAPDQLRHYHLALSPATAALTLQAPVDQPASGEKRWLGVTIYDIRGTASGLPLAAAAQALLPALGALLLALGVALCARKGYGIALALLLLALAPRLVLPGWTPPGFRPDEAVSLVDAWNIAQTGRDHLGHLLPLGAQEAFGDWISPLLTYLELPLAAVLGPNLLAGRALTALVGALAAPLAYALARALCLPKEAAICAGLVVALSPWQIFMSRIALPGALVPTCWTLCVLAGLRLIERGGRREALLLGLAAGVALYAYPTLKLAVPLLLGLAAACALLRHGWGAGRRWLPGALLAGLLWLPFVYVTLFNPASSTRLGQAAIKADSLGAWLAACWDGYRVYFGADFYYRSGDGSPIRGVPGHGVELAVGLPFVLLGLASLPWSAIGDCRWRVAAWRTRVSPSPAPARPSPMAWLFIAGALIIAPLPASLTQPSPHVYRAAPIAPLYALLVGMGLALALRLLAPIGSSQLRRAAQIAGLALLALALAWQSWAWFRDYSQDYPPRQASDNQDGLLDATRRAIGYAPQFDEVWISYEDINEPYIYVLAAQAFAPRQAQALIQVTREPGHFNAITSIGRYRFVAVGEIPKRLPVVEAIADRYGGPAFVLQDWQHDGKRILVLRRMD